MISITDYGHLTGTRDKEYDLLWFTQACLDNALRLQTFINDAADAGDTELQELFEKAQSESIKGAERAKHLLRGRI